MATVEDIVVEGEIEDLCEIAEQKGWAFERRGSRGILLGFPARDNTWFYILLDCHGYRAKPPAWHWADESGEICDDPRFTPKGHGFLHNNERICAPWNRLAYKSVDPKGPHNDWELAGWASNNKTGSCTTLAAMALRVFVELNSERYKGGRHA